MPLIDVDQILPGMVLSKNVNDTSGRLLLQAHTTLNEKHIRILRTWGVYQISVVGAEQAQASEAATRPTIVSIQQTIDQLFSSANREHPAMQAIYQLALAQAMRLAQKGLA